MLVRDKSIAIDFLAAARKRAALQVGKRAQEKPPPFALAVWQKHRNMEAVWVAHGLIQTRAWRMARAGVWSLQGDKSIVIDFHCRRLEEACA